MKTKAKCRIHKLGPGDWCGYDLAGGYDIEATTRRDVEAGLREVLGACVFERGDDLTREEWEKEDAEEEPEAPSATDTSSHAEPIKKRQPSNASPAATKRQHWQALRAASQADLTADQFAWVVAFEHLGADGVELPSLAPPQAKKRRG